MFPKVAFKGPPQGEYFGESSEQTLHKSLAVFALGQDTASLVAALEAHLKCGICSSCHDLSPYVY